MATDGPATAKGAAEALRRELVRLREADLKATGANKPGGVHVIFLGPPGAGKGTQAGAVADSHCLCHLSTGDMLRRELSRFGGEAQRKVETELAKGELVPDEVVVAMVEKYMAAPECARGFVLDGFPRNVAQAMKLDAMLSSSGGSVMGASLASPGRQRGIDRVVSFNVSEATAKDRNLGRLVHVPSGRVYHETHAPPAKGGRDAPTGEALTKRTDDVEAVISKKYKMHLASEGELLELYGRRPGLLRRVSGEGSAADVSKLVQAALGPYPDTGGLGCRQLLRLWHAMDCF